MTSHGRAQGAGALAVDHTHPAEAALLALREIIVEQPGNFRRTKSMQIQLPGDGNGDGIGGLVRLHAAIVARSRDDATINPPFAGRVYAHTTD
jgi:hypothetical protein